MPTLCQTCNSPTRENRAYCSRKCAWVARKQRRGLANTVVCGVCRKPFDPANSGRKYCSRACYFRSRERPLDTTTVHKHSGYAFLRLPEHPRADEHGNVREHIVVAEEMLGRSLLPDEEVHHKNRNRADNRPENLEVFTKSEHARLHNTEDQRVAPLLAHNRQHGPWNKKGPVPRICEKCGAPFTVRPYLVAKGYGRYCSNACKVFGSALLRDPEPWKRALAAAVRRRRGPP